MIAKFFGNGVGESTVGQLLLNVSVALVLLAYGLLALVLPHKIRRWMLHDRVRRLVAIKAYGRWVESPNYIRHLRVTGGVAILASMLLFYSALA